MAAFTQSVIADLIRNLLKQGKAAISLRPQAHRQQAIGYRP